MMAAPQIADKTEEILSAAQNTKDEENHQTNIASSTNVDSLTIP
jgi:hypothetical protein